MKKKWMALILCTCIIMSGCGTDKNNDKSSDNSKEVSVVTVPGNCEEVDIKGNTYYKVLEYMKEKDYSYQTFGSMWVDEVEGADFDERNRYISINESLDIVIDVTSPEYEALKHGKILNYKEYKALCDKYSMEQKYDDEAGNYLTVLYANTNSFANFTPVDLVCDEKANTVYYYYYENIYGVMADGSGYLCVIPTDMDENTDVIMERCYSGEEIRNLKKYNTIYDPNNITVDKPVIYLYPEEDNTAVEVTLELTDAELTCTYPVYDEGWSVVADKDGLIKSDGKEYNYLYWEGKNSGTYSMEQGFCIKGSDTAVFLEEKLAELGLNRKEANEFIVYWLPLMEPNEFNVISFDTKEYEEMFKLHVNPTPETVIRVFMTWYGTDEPVTIEPQSIETPKREGFTVVEWGGAKIK